MLNILVLGSSGKIGSKIVTNLQSQQTHVIVTTTRSHNPLANEVFLDLASGGGLASALKGIDILNV